MGVVGKASVVDGTVNIGGVDERCKVESIVLLTFESEYSSLDRIRNKSCIHTVVDDSTPYLLVQSPLGEAYKYLVLPRPSSFLSSSLYIRFYNLFARSIRTRHISSFPLVPCTHSIVFSLVLLVLGRVIIANMFLAVVFFPLSPVTIGDRTCQHWCLYPFANTFC